MHCYIACIRKTAVTVIRIRDRLKGRENIISAAIPIDRCRVLTVELEIVSTACGVDGQELYGVKLWRSRAATKLINSHIHCLILTRDDQG